MLLVIGNRLFKKEENDDIIVCLQVKIYVSMIYLFYHLLAYLTIYLNFI